MGFMNFLKPKKGVKAGQMQAGMPDMSQLPPLPSDNELYSELPNLPEAPEMSGLPEIELPTPMKGMSDFDMPDMPQDVSMDRSQPLPPLPPMPQPARAQPLMPNWPGETPKKDAQLDTLPELPRIPTWNDKADRAEDKPIDWLNLPKEAPEQQMEQESKLIRHENGHFLEAKDFQVVTNSLDEISRTPKKHHRLTELRKEESQYYDQLNELAEDLQRTLMHIDRSMFD